MKNCSDAKLSTNYEKAWKAYYEYTKNEVGKNDHNLNSHLMQIDKACNNVFYWSSRTLGASASGLNKCKRLLKCKTLKLGEYKQKSEAPSGGKKRRTRKIKGGIGCTERGKKIGAAIISLGIFITLAALGATAGLGASAVATFGASVVAAGIPTLGLWSVGLWVIALGCAIRWRHAIFSATIMPDQQTKSYWGSKTGKTKSYWSPNSSNEATDSQPVSESSEPVPAPEPAPETPVPAPEPPVPAPEPAKWDWKKPISTFRLKRNGGLKKTKKHRSKTHHTKRR
jgi:hypothetical protein